MSDRFLVNSGAPVSVTSVSGAFGSWTSIWTPPVPLDCLFVMVGNVSGNPPQVGLYDVGVGSAPQSILPNGYDIFSNTNGSYLIYPMEFPAGKPIQIRANETGGTSGALNILMYGYPKGSSPYPVCNLSQILAPTGGSNNFGPISATAPGTLYGTTLKLPAKMLSLFLAGQGGTTSGQDVLDVGLYAGPSSSALEPVLPHVFASYYEVAQFSFHHAMRVELPSFQEIYMLQNSAANVTPYGCVRLFY